MSQLIIICHYKRSVLDYRRTWVYLKDKHNKKSNIVSVVVTTCYNKGMQRTLSRPYEPLQSAKNENWGYISHKLTKTVQVEKQTLDNVAISAATMIG